MYKQKLLGFELGAPPHVQIRRVFVCTSRVNELASFFYLKPPNEVVQSLAA